MKENNKNEKRTSVSIPISREGKELFDQIMNRIKDKSKECKATVFGHDLTDFLVKNYSETLDEKVINSKCDFSDFLMKSRLILEEKNNKKYSDEEWLLYSHSGKIFKFIKDNFGVDYSVKAL